MFFFKFFFLQCTGVNKGKTIRKNQIIVWQVNSTLMKLGFLAFYMILFLLKVNKNILWWITYSWNKILCRWLYFTSVLLKNDRLCIALKEKDADQVRIHAESSTFLIQFSAYSLRFLWESNNLWINRIRKTISKYASCTILVNSLI